MKKFIFLVYLICSFGPSIHAQDNTRPLLFEATPKPCEECLVRMYLPAADPKAELRILNKADSLVKVVDISGIKGIQSTVVSMAGLPKGGYVCQMFYRGIICQSNMIYHSIVEHDLRPLDSTAIYDKLAELQLRIKALDFNAAILRNYDFIQDSLLSIQHKVITNDSLLNRIIQLNRDVAHLRLKLESFEQLMRELAILKVRNRLTENPIKKGNVYTMTRIYFNVGNSDFLEKSTAELDDLVDVLKEFPRLVIMLKGYTDDKGNYRANIKLSKDRAKNVYQYLIDKGIETERVSYEGYGSNFPLVDNVTEEDRAINRRVEFLILKE